MGISRAKTRFSRSIGVPLTCSGREHKRGGATMVNRATWVQMGDSLRAHGVKRPPACTESGQKSCHEGLGMARVGPWVATKLDA